MALGVNVKVVAIGRKGSQYMKRRPKFNIVSESLGRRESGRSRRVWGGRPLGMGLMYALS